MMNIETIIDAARRVVNGVENAADDLVGIVERSSRKELELALREAYRQAVANRIIAIGDGLSQAVFEGSMSAKSARAIQQHRNERREESKRIVNCLLASFR